MIEDSKRCGFLNSIGLMQYTNKLNNLEEKVMNGGILYENVKASKPVNSEYGVPIKQPKLNLQFNLNVNTFAINWYFIMSTPFMIANLICWKLGLSNQNKFEIIFLKLNLCELFDYL